MTARALQMTIGLAHAIAMDAGNSAMRKAGRKKWNRDDWNECCRMQDMCNGAPVSDPRAFNAWWAAASERDHHALIDAGVVR